MCESLVSSLDQSARGKKREGLLLKRLSSGSEAAVGLSLVAGVVCWTCNLGGSSLVFDFSAFLLSESPTCKLWP